MQTVYHEVKSNRNIFYMYTLTTIAAFWMLFMQQYVWTDVVEDPSELFYISDTLYDNVVFY